MPVPVAFPRRPPRRSDRREPAVMLRAADGVAISAMHDPPAAGVLPDPAADVGFVLAHGFTGSWRRPDVQAITRVLCRHGGVVGFDFRGHGGSGGGSTVGDREVLDLAVAVEWARRLGYRRIVTVGWSLGACVAIRHAATLRGVAAVVAVSGPSRWHYRGTPAMRRLHAGVQWRLGRAVLAGPFRTRVAAWGWTPPPDPPDALVGAVAPTPLLLVHGDADSYFPLEHGLWLARCAGSPSQLWVERGFGHAETAASAELVARIAAWAVRASAEVHGSPEDSARMPA